MLTFIKWNESCNSINQLYRHSWMHTEADENLLHGILINLIVANYKDSEQ